MSGIGTSTGGTFVVATGATLDLVGAGNNARFDGTYTASGAGTILLTGGQLSTESGATFNFPGTLFQWIGGAIVSNAPNPFANAGDVAIAGPVGVGGTGFTNSGVITQSGAGTLNIGYGSGFTNAAAGTFDIQNDLDLTLAGGGGGPSFNNADTLVKSAGTGKSTINQSFTNTGSLLLKSGTLAFTSSFVQTAGLIDLAGGDLSCTNEIVLDGGALIGTGTIGGTVRNHGGVVAPGHSPGKIAMTGNYLQGSNGVLAVQLGGRTAGAEYDQLTVGGTASLSGTLNVSLIDGFRPAVGDIFQLIVASSFSGAFDTINTIGFTGQVNYSAGGITITVTTVADIPLNTATRLRVNPDPNELIGGFIVTGSEPKKVIIRAAGPSLSSFFPDFLADPILELFQGNTLLASNDNWKDTDQAAIEASGVAPKSNLESAIVRTLPPGAYTAIVRGNDGTNGIGLVEAYDLSPTSKSQFGNIATRGFVDIDNNVLIGGFMSAGTGRPTRTWSSARSGLRLNRSESITL